MVVVLLKVGNFCDCKCVGCYAKQFSREWNDVDGYIDIDLKYEKVIYGLARIDDLLGLDELILHGGEPLLVSPRKFEPIFEFCAKRDLPISLQTNLRNLNDEWIEYIKKYGISVGTHYRGTPEMYERFTGKKIDDWLNGVRKIKEIQGCLGGLFYYTPEYKDYVFEKIPEIIDFAVNVGLSSINVIEYIGKVEKEMEFARFVIECFEYVVKKGYPIIIENIVNLVDRIVNGTSLGCHWNRGCLNFILMYPNGKIRMCHSQLDFDLVPDECINCEIFGICFGGCEDIRKLNGGKYPYCNDYKILWNYVSKNLNLIRRYYELNSGDW